MSRLLNQGSVGFLGTVDLAILRLEMVVQHFPVLGHEPVGVTLACHLHNRRLESTILSLDPMDALLGGITEVPVLSLVQLLGWVLGLHDEPLKEAPRNPLLDPHVQQI